MTDLHAVMNVCHNQGVMGRRSRRDLFLPDGLRALICFSPLDGVLFISYAFYSVRSTHDGCAGSAALRLSSSMPHATTQRRSSGEDRA